MVLVALLRGINVGRAKRVAMAELRAIVEGLGYRDVRTLLNSGNVVFRAPPRVTTTAAAGRIEKALAGELGVESRVTVITAAELDAAVAGNPLAHADREPSRLMVGVLADPADRARIEPMLKKDWAPDALAVGGRVAYLWCEAGVLESPLSIAFGRALGDAVTTRNWATMTKLHALAGELGSPKKRG